MKSNSIGLFLIIAFALFISSCDNNQVVNPESSLLSGKFESVLLTTNNISVSYQTAQTSSNEIGGTNSSCDTTSRLWQYSGSIGNTDLSPSSISKDSLKFKYFKMELMNFGSFDDNEVVIKFNHNSKIIDYFSFVAESNRDNDPQDARHTSVSSQSYGVILANVPYTIKPNGNIFVSIKGSEILKYQPQPINHYYSEESDGVNYDKRWQNILSINSIPDNAFIEIEIVKAK